MQSCTLYPYHRLVVYGRKLRPPRVGVCAGKRPGGRLYEFAHAGSICLERLCAGVGVCVSPGMGFALVSPALPVFPHWRRSRLTFPRTRPLCAHYPSPLEANC